MTPCTFPVCVKQSVVTSFAVSHPVWVFTVLIRMTWLVSLDTAGTVVCLVTLTVMSSNSDKAVVSVYNM